MKVSYRLTQRIERHLNARIQAALDRLEGMGACAGISKNPAAARKARINHHGGPNLPARRFVYAPVGGDGIPPEYYRELRKAIKEELSVGDVGGLYSYKTLRNVSASLERLPTIPFGTYERDEGGKLTGRVLERKTGYQIMKKIAELMAEQQRDMILSRHLEANAPATIKKKERKKIQPPDMPLVEYGRLVNSIKGWVG